MTNLPLARYAAATVGQVYRLRWQLELLFKEWKSHANLRAFSTVNRSIIEGLIWAAIVVSSQTLPRTQRPNRRWRCNLDIAYREMCVAGYSSVVGGFTDRRVTPIA